MQSLRVVAHFLASPMGLALCFAFVALLARLAGRRTVARIAGLVALLVAWGGSTWFGAQALVRPLERDYPPLRVDGDLTMSAIVVLGSGYVPRGDAPVTASLDADGLARAVEGVRLARAWPRARLVLSGGAAAGRPAPADGYALLARELGIPDTAVVVLREIPGTEDPSLDTAAEAVAVRALIGDEPFALVTSAYHMPRAMRLMQRAGARPIAAPTGQRTAEGPPGWRGWLPNSADLVIADHSLHEYVGLMALRLGLL